MLSSEFFEDVAKGFVERAFNTFFALPFLLVAMWSIFMYVADGLNPLYMISAGIWTYIFIRAGKWVQ